MVGREWIYKHVPWIHNIKNTDAVAAIDDEDPLRLLRLFNEPEGQKWLNKKGVSNDILVKLPLLGISSCANLLASIKLAKYFEMNENDIVRFHIGQGFPVVRNMECSRSRILYAIPHKHQFIGKIDGIWILRRIKSM